jgi:hypothetical protein
MPTPLRLLLILLVLAGLGVGAYLAATGSSFDYTYATARTQNTVGGYAFSYPPSWGLSREGSTSKVTAPDASVVVSLGRGPTGNLMQASTRLVDQIKGEYRRVTVIGQEGQLVGGVASLAVSGTGRNDTGVSLRFLAISIQGPGDTTFAITAFTVANADANEVVPRISEIVDSFRIA